MTKNRYFSYLLAGGLALLAGGASAQPFAPMGPTPFMEMSGFDQQTGTAPSVEATGPAAAYGARRSNLEFNICITHPELCSADASMRSRPDPSAPGAYKRPFNVCQIDPRRCAR